VVVNLARWPQGRDGEVMNLYQRTTVYIPEHMLHPILDWMRWTGYGRSWIEDAPRTATGDVWLDTNISGKRIIDAALSDIAQGWTYPEEV
jgi:hypothetical protein